MLQPVILTMISTNGTKSDVDFSVLVDPSWFPYSQADIVETKQGVHLIGRRKEEGLGLRGLVKRGLMRFHTAATRMPKVSRFPKSNGHFLLVWEKIRDGEYFVPFSRLRKGVEDARSKTAVLQ